MIAWLDSLRYDRDDEKEHVCVSKKKNMKMIKISPLLLVAEVSSRGGSEWIEGGSNYVK